MMLTAWIGNALCTLVVVLMAGTVAAGIAAAWRAGHRKVKGCVVALVTIVLVRFCGGMLLEWNNMGWRTMPRNLMDGMWITLLVLAIFQTMVALTKDQHPWAGLTLGCGWLLILVVLLGAAIRFHFFTWTDRVIEQRETYVVVEKEQSPGSIGGGRYYLYVNGLVHGARTICVEED